MQPGTPLARRLLGVGGQDCYRSGCDSSFPGRTLPVAGVGVVESMAWEKTGFELMQEGDRTSRP